MDNRRWKRFAVIGNMNAITYKEVFPLIKTIKYGLGQQGMVMIWCLVFQKGLRLMIKIDKSS